MKKNIIIEINRINNLMGRSLLNESIFPLGELRDMIETLAKKLGGKQLNEIMSELDKLAKATDNEVVDILEKIGKISPEINKEISSIVYKNLSPVNQNNITKLKEYLEKAISGKIPNVKLSPTKAKEGIGKYVDKMEGDESVKRFLKNDLEQYMDELYEIHPYVPPRGSENIAGYGDGINADNLSKKASFGDFLNQLIIDMNVGDIQTWLRAWKRVFQPMEKLQKQFNELAVIVDKNMQNGIRVDTELKKMADILVSAKKWWFNSPEFVYAEWKKNLPESVRIQLEKYAGQDKNAFRKVYDRLLAQKNVWEPYLVELDAYKKLWIYPFWNLSTFQWGKFAKNLVKEDKTVQRMLNFILIRDPRTREEIINSMMSKGVKQGIATNILFRFLFDSFIIPGFLAFVGVVGRAVIAIMESGWEKLPFTDDDAGWIDYPSFKKITDDGIRAAVWNDTWNYFVSMLPQSFWSWIRSVVDITYVDETFSKIKNLWKTAILSKNKNKIDELIEKYKNNYESQEFKDELAKLPYDTQLKIIEILDKLKKGGALQPSTPSTSTNTLTKNNFSFEQIKKMFPCTEGKTEESDVDTTNKTFMVLYNDNKKYKVGACSNYSDNSPTWCWYGTTTGKISTTEFKCT